MAHAAGTQRQRQGRGLGATGLEHPTCVPLSRVWCRQVRVDLMDTNIALCAPEVLMLFSDNFDYQNMKRDFVTGGSLVWRTWSCPDDLR